MVNQDADLAEYMIAQSRREAVMHPRCPIIAPPTGVQDVDWSGIWNMSPEQIDEACNWRAA